MTSVVRLGVYRDAPAPGVDLGRWSGSDWQLWLVVMASGLVLRLVFYTGYFGSDEVTYTLAAFNLLHDNWAVAAYVGSNRYGINLPVAGFAALFGQNEFAAALYSLVCSLAEVSLIFHFGRQMLGRRAGFSAAAVLAFMPIHVHSAGRLMADAPLALAITASFLFFWAGEARNRSVAFAWAGLAAGLAFWVKPHAMLYLGVFLTYPILFRRWNWKWAWMLAAFAAVVLANNCLFWALTGNPFFLLEAIHARQTSGYLESGTASGSITDHPLYYLVYFFGRIYHTWLAAYLAVVAVALWLKVGGRGTVSRALEIRYLVWWAFGLVLLFSLFLVSWRPLLFIPKQTNYMLMFAAPLSLLAGHALAQLSGARFWAATALMLVPSAVLAGMQQNSVRVFTANSNAALDFARSHAESEVFVNTNAFRAATFNNLVRPNAPIINIRFIGDLKSAQSDHGPGRTRTQRYAIIDTETLSWGTDEPITSIAAVPACWARVGALRPSGTGSGTSMLQAFRPVAAMLPSGLRDMATRKLEDLTRPAPAYVFEVPATECAPLDLPGSSAPAK